MHIREARHHPVTPDVRTTRCGRAGVWLAPVFQGPADGSPAAMRPDPRPDQDGACVIELWDVVGARPEAVLAVTVHTAIGYAAYYAAARDYPDRYITLRCGGRVLARWNGPTD